MSLLKSESKTKNATVSKAFGKEIEPFEYSYSYDERKFDGIKASDVTVADLLAELGKEAPSAEDILTLVNQREAAAASAKVRNEEFKARGIEAPTLEDENVAIKAMAKVFRAQNKSMSQDEAEQAARVALGKA